MKYPKASLLACSLALCVLFGCTNLRLFLLANQTDSQKTPMQQIRVYDCKLLAELDSFVLVAAYSQLQLN
jgi:hypothetical protein